MADFIHVPSKHPFLNHAHQTPTTSHSCLPDALFLGYHQPNCNGQSGCWMMRASCAIKHFLAPRSLNGKFWFSHPSFHTGRTLHRYSIVPFATDVKHISVSSNALHVRCCATCAGMSGLQSDTVANNVTFNLHSPVPLLPEFPQGIQVYSPPRIPSTGLWLFWMRKHKT